MSQSPCAPRNAPDQCEHNTEKLRIGSRPSALAIAQAELVKRGLERIVGGLRAEIVSISTTGDKLASASLARVGGKGLFIRELEQALIDRRIDLAVHSMKDLPAMLAPQYRIAAVPERENPCDALVTRAPGGWDAMPTGARLGTSSTRRRFEALRLRPDLDVIPLRGNVDTRLKRLLSGDFDAIILAMAGLRRLDRCDGINLVELDPHGFVPSGGQGALALEALAEGIIGGSAELEAAVAALNHPHSLAEVTAERSFLAAIGASCVSPVGVKGTVGGQTLHLRALLFDPHGSRSMADEAVAPFQAETPATAGHPHAPAVAAAAALGAQLGRRMLDQGAGDLIGREST
jgi:hydroxymethylbilane synthase